MVWSLCCSGNVKMEIRRCADPSKTQVDLTSIKGATTKKHLYDTDVDELVDNVGKKDHPISYFDINSLYVPATVLPSLCVIPQFL